MKMRENKLKRDEFCMDKLFWLLIPESPLSYLYCATGKLQQVVEDMICFLDDKKTDAVESLYNKLHESEDD